MYEIALIVIFQLILPYDGMAMFLRPGLPLMLGYPRVVDAVVAGLFTLDGAAISDCCHPDLLWGDVTTQAPQPCRASAYRRRGGGALFRPGGV
jgi:hypothetical protein